MKNKVKKIKFISFVLAIIAFWIIGAPITTNSILDRAIIVGLSMDYTEEGDYKLGTQIIYPAGASSTNSGSKANFIVAKGKTISEAMNKISEITGLFPSLAHCNLVLLGEKMFDGHIESALEFMIRYSTLSKNSVLTAVMGEANEILSAKTDFTLSTSTQTLKQIIKNETYSGIGAITIKDFYRNYFSYNEINFISIIKIIDPETGEEIKSAKPAASSSSDQASSEEKEKKVIFDASTFVILKKDKIAFELDYKQSRIIDLIIFKEERGTISQITDKGTYQLDITRKTLKKKSSLEKMSMDYKLKLNLILAEFTLNESLPNPDVLAKTDKLDAAETKKIEEQKKKEIEDIFKLCAEQNIDLLDIYGDFYRKYGKRFIDKMPDDFLKNIEFNAEVEIEFI